MYPIDKTRPPGDTKTRFYSSPPIIKLLNTSDHITVLLAENHLIVSEGLCSILETENDIEVVGQALDGCEAVKLAKELHPAVIIMDIAMPRLNGLDATHQILKAIPSTRILILSAHTDDAYVEQAVGLGAAGYLVKQAPFLILAEVVREAYKGNTFFARPVPKHLRDQGRGLHDQGELHANKIAKLTLREVAVLQLIAEGNANRETASELGISMKSVEKHRQALMEKLNIHNITGLTRYAISAGIIESSVELTIV